MQRKISKPLYIAALLFGSVVGAGFASGKEILFYFARFGAYSIPFAILTVVLFCVLCYTFLSLGRIHGLKNLSETSVLLFGKFSYISELVLIFGNLVLLSSMLAGSNSLFNIMLPTLPFPLAGVITALCCLLIVLKGFKLLIKINELITPIMLVVIFYLFITSLSNYTSFEFLTPPSGTITILSPLISSILFVCGNMFFVGFVVAKYGTGCTQRDSLMGSIIAGVLLLLCISAEAFAIFLTPESALSDMPLVYIASSRGYVFRTITLGAIFISILTTASIMLYTVKNYIEQFIKNKLLAAFLVIATAFMLSLLGFSNIVGWLYPVLGVFGVIFSVMAAWKMHETKKPQRTATKLQSKPPTNTPSSTNRH